MKTSDILLVETRYWSTDDEKNGWENWEKETMTDNHRMVMVMMENTNTKKTERDHKELMKTERKTKPKNHNNFENASTEMVRHENHQECDGANNGNIAITTTSVRVVQLILTTRWYIDF